MSRYFLCALLLVAPLTAGEPLFKATGKYATETTAEPSHPRNPRVLFFHAKWCIPCGAALRDLKPWLQPAGWRMDETERAHIQLVDVDDHQDLVKKYGVTSIPAMVRVDGKSHTEAVPYTGRESLTSLAKPAAKLSAVSKKNVRTQTIVQHAHKCSVCGHKWFHSDASYGSVRDHTCTKCGSVQWNKTGETRTVTLSL